MITAIYERKDAFFAINALGRFRRYRDSVILKYNLHHSRPVDRDSGIPLDLYPGTKARHQEVLEQDPQEVADEYKITRLYTPNYNALYSIGFDVLDIMLGENPNAMIFNLAKKMAVEEELNFSVGEIGVVLNWYFQQFQNWYLTYDKRGSTYEKNILLLKVTDVL